MNIFFFSYTNDYVQPKRSNGMCIYMQIYTKYMKMKCVIINIIAVSIVCVVYSSGNYTRFSKTCLLHDFIMQNMSVQAMQNVSVGLNRFFHCVNCFAPFVDPELS